MAGGSCRKRSRGRWRRRLKPMDKLTDDLFIDIFSRVPYRSLRRCSCVSRRWRDLIAHPDHRRKLPQPLAGFFYHTSTRCFANASGTGPPSVDPSLAFLPDREREGLSLVDGCNGLLLCRCFRFADPNVFDYLVINPATENWVAVPVSRRLSNKVPTVLPVCLGFDPAVSSHFHVFELQFHDDGDGESEDDDYIYGGDGHYVSGMKIYSSETGLWSYKHSGWGVDMKLHSDFKSAFVDGMLYVVSLECVIGVVDVKGRTWRIIEFPTNEGSPFLYSEIASFDVSQGRLHFVASDDMDVDRLAIWVLEDCDKEQWTLEHTVNINYLVRRQFVLFGYHGFIVAAVHPHRNTVFFVYGTKRTLMSYDMDTREIRIIRDLGENCGKHFIPYVPLFSVSLADGQQ